MTIRTSLVTTTTLLALLAGGASAQSVPQSVLDQIVSDLTAQGFSRIEIDIDDDEIDVDAYGPGISGDFYYSLTGRLLEVDLDDEDEVWGSSGSSGGGGWSDDDDDYDDYDDD
ncbi:MAG: hypothetical protein AAF914_09260, partial [Pseudomonadota bacterium]